MSAPPRGPAFGAYTAMFGAVIMSVRATLRIRARASWINRVRSGLEPAFRLRAAESRDRGEPLPRLGDGMTVVEWLPSEESALATDGAAHARHSVYRMPASGIAVAFVSDPSPSQIQIQIQI